MNITKYVRTRERDSRQPGPPERGLRHWTHVELLSEQCFLVEARIDSFEEERRRYLFADFLAALEVYEKGRFSYFDVYAYLWAPRLFPAGCAFQSIAEVYRLGSNQRLLYRFASGLMLASSEGVIEAPEKLDLTVRIFP